jgi:hypothetical protein
MIRKLVIALLVLSLWSFIACGGGSTGSSQPASSSPGGGTPPPVLPPGATFFALDIGNLSNPWPTKLGVEFGIWRTLGADLRWSQIETCEPADETNASDPCYNWSNFDQWVPMATANGQLILYTAYYTPQWASSNPDATCQTAGTGGCFAPSDVGSGDNHWKNFLAAVYSRATTDQAHISYWECWNEPNIPTEWGGTLADLNQMCQDLQSTIHALDPTAKFTTPAATGGTSAVKWLTTWINLGYATEADILAFHGYVCTDLNDCQPEFVTTGLLVPLIGAITATPVSSKPLWDTEGSDLVGHEAIQDPDMHAAFYARYTILQQSAGVAMFSYWAYDDGGNDSLINNPGTATATLNPAGTAWEQVYKWTLNAKYTTSCANTSGSVWQCTITQSGTTSLLVWDASQTCSNGICTTSNFSVPSQYTEFDDLSGNVNQPVSNGTVAIGALPIRLH